MRNWARAVAMLLMFAIPLQGFAAALHASCSLGHHRTDASTAPLPDHTIEHQHGAESNHVHADPAFDSDSTSGAGVNSDCTCGSCGLGPTAVISRVDTTLRLPAAAPFRRAIYPHIQNVTGGPERPPRYALA